MILREVVWILDFCFIIVLTNLCALAPPKNLATDNIVAKSIVH